MYIKNSSVRRNPPGNPQPIAPSSVQPLASRFQIPNRYKATSLVGSSSRGNIVTEGSPALNLAILPGTDLKAEFLVSHSESAKASILPGTKSHLFFFAFSPLRAGMSPLQESRGLLCLQARAARPANQFLIATEIIRNAPKSFKISGATRSNRNKIEGLKLG